MSLGGVFGYQTGSKGPEWSFWVQFRFQRSLDGVSEYWNGSRGPWWKFFGTKQAPEAPDWKCFVTGKLLYEALLGASSDGLSRH